MRASVIDAFGTAGEVREVAVPEVGPGEVLIRLKAAGVNPVDWKIAAGMLSTMMEHRFPIVLGFDGAGVVERVGEGGVMDSGGRAFRPGDEVLGHFRRAAIERGTYAEYVVAPVGSAIARKPAGLDFRTAAALPLSGLTAVTMLDAVSLAAGESVLVVGATGGVGTLAVQLAARRGARVIATARAESAETMRRMGAAELVDHSEPSWQERLRDAHPQGIDALLDLVNDGGGLDRVAGLLKPGGRLATAMYTADPEHFERRGIKAVNVVAGTSSETLEELAALAASGELEVPIVQEFLLEEAEAALELSRGGHVHGKLVLTM